jgi:hypothetical protein
MAAIFHTLEASKVVCTRCDFHGFKRRESGSWVYCLKKERHFPEAFNRNTARCPEFECGGVRYDGDNQPIT